MELQDYCVIDLEMTGLNPQTDQVIEVGAARVRGGKVVATMGELCACKRPLPDRIVELTGITDAMLAGKRDVDAVLADFLAFIVEDVIVGHNLSFDYRFLKQWCINKKEKLSLKSVDTLKIARALLPGEQSKKLEDLCNYFGIKRENAHRALDDVLETVEVMERLKELGEEKPELFEAKELQIKMKRQTPATGHQIERLKEYREKHGLTDEIWWDTLTRSEASRLYDKYIATYGK